MEKIAPPPEKLPIKFEASKAKYIFFVCFGLLMAIAASTLLQENQKTAWFGIALFGLMAVVLFIQCLPNASYLKLTEEGYEVRSLYRSNFYNWDDVIEFGTTRMGKRTIFSRKDNYVSIQTKSQKLPIRGIIDPMGRVPQDMADFLNAMAERYR